MDFKNKKFILIGAVVIVALLAAGGIYYFLKIKNNTPAFPYVIDFSNVQGVSSEQLQRMKDDYQRAKESYLKAPGNDNSLMIIGFLYYQLKDFTKAKEVYIKAAEARPNNYNSYWNLANTCLQLKDYPCAEQGFLKAIETGSNYAKHYVALTELYSSYMPEKKSQIPDILKKGLQVLPKDYDLLIGLAQYYAGAGDKTNAIKYYQEIIKNYPQYKQQIEEEIKNL